DGSRPVKEGGVTVALAAKSSAQTPKKACWAARSKIMRRRTSRSRIGQREDGARCGDAAEHVFAQRQQRRRSLGGNRARDQHRSAEWPAQPLNPADKVDGGADGVEVQPVGSADIAPQHLAEMQRRAEGQR